jgi:hypothetical protein
MAWTPLEREKIDNLHHRMKGLEDGTASLRLDLRENTIAVKGLSDDVREFKTTYTLTIYHAVAKRTANLTGADLQVVAKLLGLGALILYALLAGYNLFSAIPASVLVGGQ